VLGLLVLLLAAGERPDVLLVTIDTLRADRVGAYGHAPAATPHLDRLAREGVLLEDAVVQVPQTRPSHASIFTGRQPYEHGIRDNYSPPLRGHATLAERLRDAGYATAGFVAAYPVSRDSGLDRGFETFDDPFGTGARRRGGDERAERPAREVVDAALGWLKGVSARPFFAWVHLFDPHAPYLPPPPFRERFARSRYDGEVAYADAQVGRLLEWLDRTGRAGRTLVVVTSDHGEGLGDHGEDEHLFFVYDSTLRVPLLLRWPGTLPAGRRVGGQFRSVDLMPTLLDLVGLSPSPASGQSRAAELRAGGKLPDNESYAESLYGQLHFGYAPLRALRGEGWKYIDAPRPELYDLRTDPGETKNRMGDRAPVARAMDARLKTHDAGPAKAAAAAVSPEAAERLAALGYVGGAFFTGPPSGEDPKDKIAEFQAYRRDTTAALARFRRRDFAGAVRILEKLERPLKTPDGQVIERRSFNVSFYLGRSLVELRRFKEALAPLRHAAALNPTSAAAALELARAQAGAGQGAEALATIDKALALAPTSAELHQLRGRILAEAGRADAAREALEKAKGLDPDNPLLRVDLSNFFRGQGDLKRSLAEAEAAVRLDAKSADAQVALGLALGASGREADAGRAFQAALRLAPAHPDALFFTAATELRAGRPAAAVPLLQRLLKAVPGYPRAKEMLAAAQQGAPAAP
jgi:arylsulfatase A-like enzyme/Flp pilus assembly protein TadD